MFLGEERSSTSGRFNTDVGWRGWLWQVPHAGEGVGEQRPDEPLAILDGADIVCQRRQYDDVVRDEAAGLIAPASGIRQAQSDQVVYALAQCRLAFSACECSLVDRERVRVAPVEEEAEAP